MERKHLADHDAPLTLVLGGTGKTGRRVVERLGARGIPTRVGSRAGVPRFDWDDRRTWAPALTGVGAIYARLTAGKDAYWHADVAAILAEGVRTGIFATFHAFR